MRTYHERIFQLVVTEEGTGIRVYTPTEDGAALDVNIVRDYLDDRKIEYDVVKVNEAVTNADNESVVIFSQAKVLPEREGVRFETSKDKMTVTAIFYPPTEGAQFIDEAEIIKELAYRKINTGVKTDNIKAFLPCNTGH